MEAVLGEAADGDGCLRLDRFVELALYAPGLGYYERERQRVGRKAGTDFYTASTLGPVFAELVVESVCRLLDGPAEDYIFVEIGAEPEGGLLSGKGCFGGLEWLRRGAAPALPKRAVVFANELLDAQPFRRFRGRGAGESAEEAWVRLAGGGRLEWAWRAVEADVAAWRDLPDGYVVDWPCGAAALWEAVLREDWEGLVLTFDYGLPEAVALRERPAGTARSYYRHQMSDDLLADPGQRDLTCHIWWDPLERELERRGFGRYGLQRQEGFLVEHGQAALGRILERAGGGFSREKQTVMELLHPQHMGGKFQALWGVRG